MEEANKVLALKYRPKRFEDLVGQDTISQTLSLALDTNRLSHAYLFSGLRGSGKTSTARIMAKALLCETGPTSKPCETCSHCVSTNNNSHLDVIEMDAASNRGIDDIKDLIEHTKYKPSSARFKVFIIDEVHMLTTAAFNALLKTLEEPPGFVKFILATTDALKLPATILSRTQHFRFKRISNKDVIHHLSHILNEEGIDFETESLDILSRSGQGSLRDTLTLLDQAIIFSKGKVTRSCVVDMLGLIDPDFMETIFDTVLNKKDINDIIHRLEEYEASSVCDEMAIYLKDKMLNRDPRFDVLLFDRFFRVLAEAKHLLGLNSDASFVLLLSLLKMQEATNIRSINELINQVQNIEVTKTVSPIINQVKQASIVKASIIENKVAEVKEVITAITSPLNPVENIAQIAKDKIIEDIISTSIQTVDYSNTSANKNVTPFDSPLENVTPFDAPVVQQETIKNETPFDMPVVSKVPTASLTPFDAPSSSVIPQNQTPFDAPIEVVEKLEPVKSSEIVEQSKSLEDFLSKQEIQEVKEKVENIPESVKELNLAESAFTPDQEFKSEFKDKFELVLNKVHDRDVELGHAFEDNFIFKNFDNNTLFISSFAQGDERKLLFKHFALLKSFMYDVYGQEIEIEFVKEEVIKEQKKNDVMKPQIASMIEDVVLEQDKTDYGSGCVADMHKTANPKDSQQELQINDILNSTMMDKAKELFDVKKITVKTKT
ncbi:MAG: DNA polymerase III subunit gamma/tau [Campylobacteraceae bacterium]|nr:DNA polymerase III subunit gamma/tau [Campylobacteraceae bacterium]